MLDYDGGQERNQGLGMAKIWALKFICETSNEHRSNIKNWFQKNWPFHAIPIFAFITETWKWATFQAKKALAWGDLLWSACQAEGLCVAVCVHAPDDVLVLALEWFWLKLQESGILTPCPGKQRAVLRIANSPGAGWMYGCMDVWMYGCMDVRWFTYMYRNDMVQNMLNRRPCRLWWPLHWASQVSLLGSPWRLGPVTLRPFSRLGMDYLPSGKLT